LMADVGNEFGLEFPDLTEPTKGELEKIMPTFASIANPMDVTAEAVARPGILTQAAEGILKDPNVDNLVMFFCIVPGSHEKLATAMTLVSPRTDKLDVMTWFALPRQDIWMSVARAGVRVFPEPARGIRSLGKMAQYVETRERVLSRHTGLPGKSGLESEIEKILDQAKTRKRNAL